MIKKTLIVLSLFLINLCHCQNSDEIIKIIENQSFKDSDKIDKVIYSLKKLTSLEIELKRMYNTKSVEKWVNQLLKKGETVNFFIKKTIQNEIEMDRIEELDGFQEYKNSSMYLEKEEYDSIFVKKIISTLSNENKDKLLKQSGIHFLLICFPYPSSYSFAKRHNFETVLRILGSKKAWKGINLDSEIGEKTQKYFRDEFIELDSILSKVLMPRYYVKFTHRLLNKDFNFSYEVISEGESKPFNEYILWEYGWFLKNQGYSQLYDFTKKYRSFEEFNNDIIFKEKISEIERDYIKKNEKHNKYWSKKLKWQKLFE